MNGHFDVTFFAGGHNGIQEILEVAPQCFMVNVSVILKELIQLCHAFGFPAGERHVVFFGEIQNILRHGVVIILKHTLFIEKRSGAVADFMEKIAAGPVKDGHKVIADNFYAELGQVANALLVVFDEGITGRLADFDVIVNVNGFNDVAVKAVSVQLIHDLGDLRFFPDFAGHFVMQSPDDGAYTGDLLDVRQFDLVVAFSVPAETHLHWHIIPPLKVVLMENFLLERYSVIHKYASAV